jgi:transcription antitermination factor NusG
VEIHKIQWQGEALPKNMSTTNSFIREIQSAGIHAEGAAAAAGSTVQRHWFAIRTRSHHEKGVLQRLTGRGIQSYLPLYRTVHQWTSHRTAALDLPLFPTYLFIHIAPQERMRAIQVPGVLNLVGPGNTPSPLQDEEIESLRAGLSLRRFEPHPYLVAGARVRIATGPLAGLEGVVQRRKGCLRVVLTVDFIAQSVAVEMDAEELEPCGSHAR